MTADSNVHRAVRYHGGLRFGLPLRPVGSVRITPKLLDVSPKPPDDGVDSVRNAREVLFDGLVCGSSDGPGQEQRNRIQRLDGTVVELAPKPFAFLRDSQAFPLAVDACILKGEGGLPGEDLKQIEVRSPKGPSGLPVQDHEGAEFLTLGV
jgi:hypothetical protein